MRLIRSIFMLIPLLGLHFMYTTRRNGIINFLRVFLFINLGAVLTKKDGKLPESLQTVNLFFDVILTSFEGLAVALLYFYFNSEVRKALWKLISSSWFKN